MQRSILEECLRLTEARIPFAVATVVSAGGSVPGKIGFQMIVYSDGRQRGTVGGAGLEEKVKKQALENISTGKSGTYKFDLTYRKPGGLDSICGGTAEVFVEAVKPGPHILICGGGHVGLEVAHLCDQLEYPYTVLDVRPEFASAQRFPGARSAHAMGPEEFRSKVNLEQFSHIVICGHSYHVDEDLLAYFARQFSGYIGVIGSATKRKEMVGHLVEKGVPREILERVECPIGLSIGAESPAEIAVSILGAVIKNFRGANTQ